MIQADPSGRFVLHVDLALDQIFVWKFDDQNGTLIPERAAVRLVAAGRWTAAFSFHPSGRWFYSIQEEGSTIVLFDYNAETGRLAPRQTISSLPAGFAGTNFCSEILVSADGRFVYAGNRLHDSIGIFAVAADGTLRYRRRRMDARRLSAQLQLRPHRPVPLLLQSARRQHRGIPRESQNRRAQFHRPLRGRRQSVDHRLCGSGKGELNSGSARSSATRATQSEPNAAGPQRVVGWVESRFIGIRPTDRHGSRGGPRREQSRLDPHYGTDRLSDGCSFKRR